MIRCTYSTLSTIISRVLSNFFKNVLLLNTLTCFLFYSFFLSQKLNCVFKLCIHSAGCGRTGAICAIDYTWNLLKAGVRIFLCNIISS